MTCMPCSKSSNPEALCVQTHSWKMPKTIGKLQVAPPEPVPNVGELFLGAIFGDRAPQSLSKGGFGSCIGGSLSCLLRAGSHLLELFSGTI